MRYMKKKKHETIAKERKNTEWAAERKREGGREI